MQDTNLRDILTQILIFIDFDGDREEFIAQFFHLCNQLTISALLDNAEGERREKLVKILSAQSFTDEDDRFLRELIETEEYRKILSEKVRENLEDYLKTIAPLVDAPKQQVLQKAIASLQEVQSPTPAENTQPQG